jgi:hypothetical protein
LKGGWSIAKAENHDKGFKKAQRAVEDGLSFITIFDLYVIITPLYIKLGKVMGFLEFVNEFRDEWEQGGIFNSNII